MNKDFIYTLEGSWPMKNCIKRLFFLFFISILGFSMPLIAETIEYQPISERDPFVSLIDSDGMLKMAGQEVVYESNLVIEGIIYDPSGQSVIVSEGEVYREGEQVLGATILKIYKDRVLLIENDEEKTVWLREEILS